MDFVNRLRAFEQRCQEHMKEFMCPVHLCLGQEAAPNAIFHNIEQRDWLFSTHRNHGHYLAKGGSEEKLWDEIMGLPTGVNGGWSGSQWYSDPSINFHATAMVGGLVGVAAGTAMALQQQGQGDIAVCCIGDGATEQGVFWEALNFAALRSLPLLFVCENNEYSVHAPLRDRQPPRTTIHRKVASFGVTVLDEQYFEQAVYLVRRNRPALVEFRCERECNHVGNMPDFRSGDKL